MCPDDAEILRGAIYTPILNFNPGEGGQTYEEHRKAVADEERRDATFPSILDEE